MTKKHYEAIAAIIKSTYTNAKLYNGINYRDTAHERCETLETTSIRLADFFAQDNPKFDRERFLEACGVQDN